MVNDLIHSLALHLSKASRSSSQELRQSRTREENTHVRFHYTTSALRCGMHCCRRTSRLRCIRRAVRKKRDACGKSNERCTERDEHRFSSRNTRREFSKKPDTQHSRYVTKSITALRRTRWLIAEGEREKLVRLDEVLKRLVVVKVLDRVGQRAAEHGQYLMRHIVYINGQGFEWLEDPKHLAAIIRNSSKVGAKPQSSPSSKDLGKSDPEALDELEEVEGKLYQQDTGTSIYVSSGKFDIQFCVQKLSEMMTTPRKLGNLRLARLARYFVGTEKLVLRFDHQKYGDTVGIAVDSDWAGSEQRYSTHARLEFHGEHLVDSWVASDQVRLSSGEAELYGIVDGSARGTLHKAHVRGERRWEDPSTSTSKRTRRLRSERVPERALERPDTFKFVGHGSKTPFVTRSCA